MCPQSVALGVSPVNRLCGCSFADAGSIPQFVGRPVQSLEELRWLHVQGLDDFQDVDQRKVVLSPLNASHVTAVYAASISKRLLRVPRALRHARTASPNRTNSSTLTPRGSFVLTMYGWSNREGINSTG